MDPLRDEGLAYAQELKQAGYVTLIMAMVKLGI